MKSTPPEGAKVVTISVAQVWIDEYGFCRINLTGDSRAQMGIPEVHEICDAVHDICDGKKHKHIIDARKVHGQVLPGAREELRRNEKMLEVRTAAAMIVDNIANKLMVTFFIQFNKPPYPYRVFESEEDAVEWLSALK
jgi:hypothetical protein